MIAEGAKTTTTEKLSEGNLEDLELPYVIKNKTLMSPGVWNNHKYTNNTIETAITNTEWSQKNRSLFWEHEDESAKEWVGEIKNPKYKNGDMLGDLYILDKPLAIKLAYGAKFGISPKITGVSGYNNVVQNANYENFSIVLNPAVKTTFLNSEIKTSAIYEGDKFRTKNGEEVILTNVDHDAGKLTFRTGQSSQQMNIHAFKQEIVEKLKEVKILNEDKQENVSELNNIKNTVKRLQEELNELKQEKNIEAEVQKRVEKRLKEKKDKKDEEECKEDDKKDEEEEKEDDKKKYPMPNEMKETMGEIKKALTQLTENENSEEELEEEPEDDEEELDEEPDDDEEEMNDKKGPAGDIESDLKETKEEIESESKKVAQDLEEMNPGVLKTGFNNTPSDADVGMAEYLKRSAGQ